MKALPSIDLEAGRAVKRVRGKRGTGLALGDPLAIARRVLEAGFTRLHVIDLDGAERGSPTPANLETAGRIHKETQLPLQLGGGIRSLDAARRACSTPGVDTLILGTAWLRDPQFPGEVEDETGCRTLAALEVRRGRPVVAGWTREADKSLDQALLDLSTTRTWGVLLTLVDVEGTLSGVVGEVEKLVTRARATLGGRVIEYSGGIASMSDLEALERMGVDYAVLGMALYRGLLDWREVARRYG